MNFEPAALAVMDAGIEFSSGTSLASPTASVEVISGSEPHTTPK